MVSSADAAHLLRRAGFGGSSAEIAALAGKTRAECVAAVMGFEDGDPVRMSLPAEKALDPDTLIAFTMNGEPLIPAHGAPARLIVPGWVFTPLGPEQFMKFGMQVDEYAKIVVPQLLARRRFVVSHGYNTVRIAERMDELEQSYAKYALPPEQDAKHDVQTVMRQLLKHS